VNVAGKVNGAGAVDGVPARGVGLAQELSREAHAGDGLFGGQADDLESSVPGGAAGGAPQDLDAGDPAVDGLGAVSRGTELLTVGSEADLPPEAASRGRRDEPLHRYALARGHHRNGPLQTSKGELVPQVRVTQKVEHQIRLQGVGQVGIRASSISMTLAMHRSRP